MSENAARWRAMSLRHAADVLDSMGDEELLAIVKRVRGPVSEWLRVNAEEDEYYPVKFSDDERENVQPVEWVMRLLIEQRNHTMKKIQLGPRDRHGTVQ